MKNLKNAIIKEITQEIDCGSDCYFNPKTKEIIAIHNVSNFPDYDMFEATFEKDIEKVTANTTEYIKIKTLECSQSFEIMERFAEILPRSDFKTEMTAKLVRKKPLQNFKATVEYSDYSAQWFEFKKNALEEIVEKQIKMHL